jgi:hypothetical protein
MPGSLVCFCLHSSQYLQVYRQHNFSFIIEKSHSVLIFAKLMKNKRKNCENGIASVTYCSLLYRRTH